MTVYAAPGATGAKLAYKTRYDNFIGGKFVAPVEVSVITQFDGPLIEFGDGQQSHRRA